MAVRFVFAFGCAKLPTKCEVANIAGLVTSYLDAGAVAVHFFQRNSKSHKAITFVSLCFLCFPFVFLLRSFSFFCFFSLRSFPFAFLFSSLLFSFSFLLLPFVFLFLAVASFCFLFLFLFPPLASPRVLTLLRNHAFYRRPFLLAAFQISNSAISCHLSVEQDLAIREGSFSFSRPSVVTGRGNIMWAHQPLS